MADTIISHRNYANTLEDDIKHFEQNISTMKKRIQDMAQENHVLHNQVSNNQVLVEKLNAVYVRYWYMAPPSARPTQYYDEVAPEKNS